ncbi:HK97-gp10 family putative phage morphogenesis protein [Streptomyces sp. DH12]|uniref:HK97-gp10 family putative phage morphogenesis protein n=1 Tax=Streptomyces sp. DH12 TaxID=2857010 RepID=UPI001E290DED|nr:HK97-gp10 family putative phage morphogenesis protein [Streptomyces sp. DH12]
MAQRARLEGLDRALRAVGRIPQAMREARTETLQEWAGAVEEGAKARVPRDTGQLHDAIEQRVNDTYGRAEVGVWQDDQLEYSLHVEKGTSSMSDQPYLIPAFDEARPQVTRTYRAAVRRRLGGGG